MTGLDVPTASYEMPGVSISFPGTVREIDGGTATNVLDSLPRAEDWRSLNRLSSVELIKHAAAHKVKVYPSYYFLCALV